MTDISIRHQPISFVLVKYKKTYFLSYQLILQHDIAIDNQNYVVHLSIRSFGSDTGVHRLITVPLSSDNDKIISRTIEDMYKQHLTQCSDIQLPSAQSTLPQPKSPQLNGILKVGSSRGLKPTLIQKHVTFNLPPLDDTEKHTYYKSPNVVRKAKLNLNLRDPMNKELLTYKCYRI